MKVKEIYLDKLQNHHISQEIKKEEKYKACLMNNYAVSYGCVFVFNNCCWHMTNNYILEETAQGPKVQKPLQTPCGKSSRTLNENKVSRFSQLLFPPPWIIRLPSGLGQGYILEKNCSNILACKSCFSYSNKIQLWYWHISTGSVS